MICQTELATSIQAFSAICCVLDDMSQGEAMRRCQMPATRLYKYVRNVIVGLHPLRPLPITPATPAGTTMSTILRARVAPNMRSLLSQPQSLLTVSKALARTASSSTAGGTPALVRRYTVPADATGPDPAPKKTSVAKPPARPKPKVPTWTATAPELGQARHEVHEGTASISMPFNPPGGGPNAGGGGGFTFTNSPVLDAILTTAMGIGAGASSRLPRNHVAIGAQLR